MSRLILKCPYLKAGSAAAHKEHYTRDIAIRDDAEPIEPEPDLAAKRPRAERIGSHGLFTQEGAVVLFEVAQTIAQHNGNVWLPIISLRREDAERLGYSNGKAWRELLRAQPQNLQGEFSLVRELSQRSTSPACTHDLLLHQSNEGYLTERGIKQLKSGLAK